jgi:hypothetical protein
MDSAGRSGIVVLPIGSIPAVGQGTKAGLEPGPRDPGRYHDRRRATREPAPVCLASEGHLSSCWAREADGRSVDARLVPGWEGSWRRPAKASPGGKPLLRRVGGRCRVRPMILTGLAHGARHGPVWATEEAAREDPDVGSAAEAGRAPRVSVKISYIADRRDCQGRSPQRSRRGESKMLGDSEAIR